ncbi:MAG: glycosyltransferase [Bacteroidia bacterium]|nr:glycosyltransferase [Bacteroidia bacterium]MDW8089255.1 glycosyltransferase [Bacteroidia bacterium]
MQRVIHCILNNLVYEQRLHKIGLTLGRFYEVELVGVRTFGERVSLPERPYKVKHLRVPVRGGPLFFLWANGAFLLYLLRHPRWDAVIACDLDILPACWLAAKLRGKAIVLDSRELYTGLPVLMRRPVRRWIWAQLERIFYPRVPYILTVSPPIAAYIQAKYRRWAWVIYNLPLRQPNPPPRYLRRLLILYQGMLQLERGLEELIGALAYTKRWELLIVGDGPLRQWLERLAQLQGVAGRVSFEGLVPFERLPSYAAEAAVGVSGELPRAPNHRYALPNKVFDYLQLGLPVLVGEAPLIRRLVEHYRCGWVVERWLPHRIAQVLVRIASSPQAYEERARNAQQAASQLYWERQAPCIEWIVKRALQRLSATPEEAGTACTELAFLDALFREEEMERKGENQ